MTEKQEIPTTTRGIFEMHLEGSRACMTSESGGDPVPMLAVHHDEGLDLCALASGFDHRRGALMRQLGEKYGRQVPTCVCLMSLAYVASYQGDSVDPREVPPRDSPNRREVLIVCAVGNDGETYSAMAETCREDDSDPLLEFKSWEEKPEAVARGFLVEEFWRGVAKWVAEHDA